MASEATGQHAEQLDWERRNAPRVAAAAVAAALLMMQGPIVQAVLYEDRPKVDSTPDFLLSLHEHTSGFVLSAIGEAIGVLALGIVFYYLFRVTRYRAPELPEFFRWLVILAPLAVAVVSVVGVIEQAHVADTFVAGERIMGDAGKERAKELLKDGPSIAIAAIQFAAHIAIAFLYVMLSLRAMRAGLLSRFMGILGVVLGALLVIQVIPQPLIQLFWLIAIAALFLGYWPNGRGPAWDTGEATPWPQPVRGGGFLQPGGGGNGEGAEPEPVPERPPSRKRKRTQD